MTAQHITVEQVCVHTVVTIQHDLPIVQCAKIMHDEQVGSLIITEVRDGLRLPIGILTDRDITIKVLAFALDPQVFTARDIMAQPLVTARMDESLVSVLTRMQLHGVRRVPVVSQAGALLGILEADDIWEIFAEEVDSLERIILAKRSQNSAKHPKTRKSAQFNPVGLGENKRLKRQIGATPWL
jgi:predicted transcriptional regulator